MEHIQILLAGDCAVSIQFGDTINPDIYAKVASLNAYLKSNPIDGIIETIPTYRSLMIEYNPTLLSYDKLVEKIYSITENLSSIATKSKKIYTIPVCFDENFAPDLEYVAKYHNTTKEKIIEEFCSQDFLIYMLGFTPGFPYIGGVPKTLETPRLSSPRVEIPAGSVGIGGAQLGIYPISSPAGFQLVGNTPISLYDQNRTKNPVLLEAGAYIRFCSIDLNEYNQIKSMANNYVCQIKES